MSVATIIFSKDRPAQLDLCLRSVDRHLPELRPIAVLYTSSAYWFDEGYDTCREQHAASAMFIREKDFRGQVLSLLTSSGSDFATLLCDDDVAFRAPNLATAQALLRLFPTVLCFSLRLGANTTECYSLRKAQAAPESAKGAGCQQWYWRDAEGDWSYPGSLDGHIWRRDQLLTLISARDGWRSPNELEDALNQACQTALLPEMASFEQSCLTGVPVNSVQSTHQTNRFGERYHADPRTINDRYLRGGRLALESVVAGQVDAAHTEFPLRWAA